MRPAAARDRGIQLEILDVQVSLTLVGGIGGAWAEGKVNITRKDNKPKDVEVKAGEEVRFINSAAQTVHVWFGGDEAPRFYVPAPGPR